MERVLPGVHTWSVFSEEKQLHFNGFHVEGPTGAVVIDPPAPSEADAAALVALAPPAAIILTNKDHVRGTAAVVALLGGPPVLVPAADADLFGDLVLAERFGDGVTLEAGVVTRHLRGLKSPGETALHLPWLDALVLGDSLIGKPTGEVSLLPPQKVPDREAARASIARLLELRFDALLLADGAMLPTGGRAAIERFLARPD